MFLVIFFHHHTVLILEYLKVVNEDDKNVAGMQYESVSGTNQINITYIIVGIGCVLPTGSNQRPRRFASRS